MKRPYSELEGILVDSDVISVRILQIRIIDIRETIVGDRQDCPLAVLDAEHACPADGELQEVGRDGWTDWPKKLVKVDGVYRLPALGLERTGEAGQTEEDRLVTRDH